MKNTDTIRQLPHVAAAIKPGKNDMTGRLVAAIDAAALAEGHRAVHRLLLEEIERSCAALASVGVEVKTPQTDGMAALRTAISIFHNALESIASGKMADLEAAKAFASDALNFASAKTGGDSGPAAA